MCPSVPKRPMCLCTSQSQRWKYGLCVYHNITVSYDLKESVVKVKVMVKRGVCDFFFFTLMLLRVKKYIKMFWKRVLT